MAIGYDSSAQLSLREIDPDETGKPLDPHLHDLVWSVRMTDGPLKLGHVIDHEITLSLANPGTGETTTLAIDGNASTWETFRRLAESDIPALSALFGGTHLRMMD